MKDGGPEDRSRLRSQFIKKRSGREGAVMFSVDFNTRTTILAKSLDYLTVA